MGGLCGVAAHEGKIVEVVVAVVGIVSVELIAVGVGQLVAVHVQIALALGVGSVVKDDVGDLILLLGRGAGVLLDDVIEPIQIESDGFALANGHGDVGLFDDIHTDDAGDALGSGLIGLEDDLHNAGSVLGGNVGVVGQLQLRAGSGDIVLLAGGDLGVGGLVSIVLVVQIALGGSGQGGELDVINFQLVISLVDGVQDIVGVKVQSVAAADLAGQQDEGVGVQGDLAVDLLAVAGGPCGVGNLGILTGAVGQVSHSLHLVQRIAVILFHDLFAGVILVQIAAVIADGGEADLVHALAVDVVQTAADGGGHSAQRAALVVEIIAGVVDDVIDGQFHGDGVGDAAVLHGALKGVYQLAVFPQLCLVIGIQIHLIGAAAESAVDRTVVGVVLILSIVADGDTVGRLHLLLDSGLKAGSGVVILVGNHLQLKGAGLQSIGDDDLHGNALGGRNFILVGILGLNLSSNRIGAGNICFEAFGSPLQFGADLQRLGGAVLQLDGNAGRQFAQCRRALDVEGYGDIGQFDVFGNNSLLHLHGDSRHSFEGLAGNHGGSSIITQSGSAVAGNRPAGSSNLFSTAHAIGDGQLDFGQFGLCISLTGTVRNLNGGLAELNLSNVLGAVGGNGDRAGGGSRFALGSLSNGGLFANGGNGNGSSAHLGGSNGTVGGNRNCVTLSNLISYILGCLSGQNGCGNLGGFAAHYQRAFVQAGRHTGNSSTFSCEHAHGHDHGQGQDQGQCFLSK